MNGNNGNSSNLESNEEKKLENEKEEKNPDSEVIYTEKSLSIEPNNNVTESDTKVIDGILLYHY